METEHLKEYIVFAKTLNYASAADELFVSQPTLRSHIKAIEDELGTPLTIRRDNRLELSPTGKLFAVKAREIASAFDAAVEECKHCFADFKSITVGTLGCAWFEDMLYEARNNYEKHHTGKHMEILFAQGMHANAETVLSGKADLTIYPHVRGVDDNAPRRDALLPEELGSIYIKSEKHWFWMTGDNPLFEKDTITARDLSEYKLIVGNTKNMTEAGKDIAEHFRRKGIDLEINNWPCADYTEYFFSGGKDTFGIYMLGMVPNLEGRKNCRVFTIEDLEIFNDVYVVYDKRSMDEYDSDYLKELEALVSE